MRQNLFAVSSILSVTFQQSSAIYRRTIVSGLEYHGQMIV